MQKLKYQITLKNQINNFDLAPEEKQTLLDAIKNLSAIQLYYLTTVGQSQASLKQLAEKIQKRNEILKDNDQKGWQVLLEEEKKELEALF